MGEADSLMVYPNPDIKILKRLRKSKTRTELCNNLPKIPFSAQFMIEHYLKIGRYNNVMYGGIANGKAVVFVELPEFYWGIYGIIVLVDKLDLER